MLALIQQSQTVEPDQKSAQKKQINEALNKLQITQHYQLTQQLSKIEQQFLLNKLKFINDFTSYSVEFKPVKSPQFESFEQKEKHF